MEKFRFIEKVPAIFRNKYIITIIIFLIWLLLLDSNNLISRYKELRELHKLRNEREYYRKKIEIDRQKLQELKTDNESLEKFAREQYRMKKPEEDLYIILSPKEDREISRENK